MRVAGARQSCKQNNLKTDAQDKLSYLYLLDTMSDSKTESKTKIPPEGFSLKTVEMIGRSTSVKIVK